MASRYYAKSKADLAINAAAAKIAQHRPEMRAAAEKVLAQLKAVAAASEKSGRYEASLDIVKTEKSADVHDYRVISRDPAAFAIEYGHLSGRRVAEGPLREGEERKGRRWVMGKYYMTQTAAMVKKGA